jgi:alpha-beta hydrolase superfamily lysophospholipase
LRYERFARAANDRGIEAWACDHRGHGQTAGLEHLGDYGEGGWDALVADLGQLVALARETHPGLPLVLLGHSMGSIAAQQYAPDGSHAIDALILSGSTAREAPREGETAPPLALNARFEPARTPFDWLSRDEAEVDRYAADPFCGFDMGRMRRPNQRANPSILSDRERLRGIRADLPCLFVAGDQDPINRDLEGLRLLESWWREAGVRRIDTLYYEGGRHEMLNETNRDEVTRDILDWVLGVTSV